MYHDKTLQNSRSELMGIEGNMARLYWAQLSAALPPDLAFGTRSRRPAQDVFNACLNYLYGMLYNVVGNASLAAGLDTHLGFLHVDRYKHPTFVFDMIEPFRPWVDLCLMTACIDGKIGSHLVDVEEGKGHRLNRLGKQLIIPIFNDLMQERTRFRHHQLSRKNHIHRYAGEFAQFLLHRSNLSKEEDHDPFDLL